jgi:hypothetical protein
MNTGTHQHQVGMVIMSQPGIRFIRPLGSPQPTLGKGPEIHHARETQAGASESYVQGDQPQWSMPFQPRRSRRRKRPRLKPEELVALQKLRERNASQWLDAVRQASRTQSVRAQLAAIVVWDYFFDNPEPHMRDRALLIQWMREWSMQTCPNQAVLARALIRLGYPPRLAELRSRIEQ